MKAGVNRPWNTSATGPCMVRSKASSSSIRNVPPGALTVTGEETKPRRTAALAAAHEEEPEAWVSPAPRSQIRM